MAFLLSEELRGCGGWKSGLIFKELEMTIYYKPFILSIVLQLKI
jgi:hypothetical protein